MGLESLVVYPSPDHAGSSISARAGVAWFKDPDGNLFSIEGDR